MLPKPNWRRQEATIMSDGRLDEIWKQQAIPVILRRDGWHEKLRVRLPKADDDGKWINGLGKSRAVWIYGGSYWELPKSWFNKFVNEALVRYKSLYVVQPYREQEKCAPACMNASGHECECSCMGANHGAGNDGSWFEVSDTFATRWHERELACRLMVAKER
jgi:hypothetical protein